MPRHKRLLLSAAVGAAAGAGAAYYAWDAVHSEQINQGQDRLSTLLRSLLGVKPEAQAATPPATETDHDEHEGQEHSDEEHTEGQQAQGEEANDENSMDASMNEHFQFIQNVSTPQELEELLPQLLEVVSKSTDVATSLRSLPPAATTADKLQAMARASCARALAAVLLVPLSDLYVRTKLNIIGRHLFLQERLSRLLHPTTTHTMGVLLGGMATPVSSAPGPMPPKLDAAGVEAFLGCQFFVEQGVQWLVAQVVEGVGAALCGMKLEADLTPQEAVAALGAMLVAVEGRVAAAHWPDVLVGSDTVVQTTRPAMEGDTLAHSLATSAMLEELHGELRGVLVSGQFQDAVKAGVHHTFKVLAAHVFDAFPTVVANGGVVPAAGGSSDSAAQSGGGAGVGASTGSGPAAQAPTPTQPATPASPFSGAQATTAQPQPQTLQLSDRVNSTGLRISNSLKSMLGVGGSPSSPRGVHSNSQGGGAVAPPPRPPPPQKQPRALARLLKPIHGAGDDLLDGSKHISKGLSKLPPVMALSAHVFAPPRDEEEAARAAAGSW